MLRSQFNPQKNPFRIPLIQVNWNQEFKWASKYPYHSQKRTNSLSRDVHNSDNRMIHRMNH